MENKGKIIIKIQLLQTDTINVRQSYFKLFVTMHKPLNCKG